MVTKPPSANSRRAFRWRLLMAILGMIALDHFFLAPAHAAPPAQPGLMASASVTALLR